MKPLIPITKVLPGRAFAWIPAILFFPLIITGCGDKKDEGVEAVFLADFSNAGVGDSGSYPDGFLTSDAIQIGVKSVKLIKAEETEPSYTIFDTEDNTDPVVLDLNATTQSAVINPVFPTGCPCDFSKVQVELTFMEVQVPVYDGDIAVNRRFRFYTIDLTDPDLGVPVTAGDVLVADLSNALSFNWIDTTDGGFVSLTSARPTVPLQAPAARFPDDAYGAAVTMDLPSFFEIPDKPEGMLTVTLTVHAGSLFFYDETDTEEPALTRFDRYTDGRLNANEPDSHFYPTFPTITAAFE